jgi:hypothetical protein
MIETDASDYAMGAILSQQFEDGKIHPVAFISKKFSPAELNQQIYDKEILAIVYAMKEWRCYIQGAIHTTVIYSDHMNLQYFKETNQLNRRQARWAETLQEYNFKMFIEKEQKMEKQMHDQGVRSSPLERAVQHQQTRNLYYDRNFGQI